LWRDQQQVAADVRPGPVSSAQRPALGPDEPGRRQPGALLFPPRRDQRPLRRRLGQVPPGDDQRAGPPEDHLRRRRRGGLVRRVLIDPIRRVEGENETSFADDAAGCGGPFRLPPPPPPPP